MIRRSVGPPPISPSGWQALAYDVTVLSRPVALRAGRGVGQRDLLPAAAVIMLDPNQDPTEATTMADDAHERGFKKRAELWGEEHLVNDQCFGEVWSRPGLPTKTRSMITMAALLVLGRAPELKIHMRGALSVGVTPEEIKELIIHLSQYGGIPVAVEAIRTFREVTEGK